MTLTQFDAKLEVFTKDGLVDFLQGAMLLAFDNISQGSKSFFLLANLNKFYKIGL